MLVELGPLMRDTTVQFYPAVFLANAIAAFILNLVSALHSSVDLTWLQSLPGYGRNYSVTRLRG